MLGQIQKCVVIMAKTERRKENGKITNTNEYFDRDLICSSVVMPQVCDIQNWVRLLAILSICFRDIFCYVPCV